MFCDETSPHACLRVSEPTSRLLYLAVGTAHKPFVFYFNRKMDLLRALSIFVVPRGVHPPHETASTRSRWSQDRRQSRPSSAARTNINSFWMIPHRSFFIKLWESFCYDFNILQSSAVATVSFADKFEEASRQ